MYKDPILRNVHIKAFFDTQPSFNTYTYDLQENSGDSCK